jgi:hypothetical protein
MNSFYCRTTLESLDHLKGLLSQHKRVFYTRFGDGEVYSMFGRDCLEHSANKKLAVELQASFLIDHPQYIKAVGVNYKLEPGMIHGLFAPFIDNDQLAAQLEQNFPFVKGQIFENHVMFHYLSVFHPDMISSFLDQFVRPKQKLFIGSTPKEFAEKLYGPIGYYVQTPARDAYGQWDSWWPQVLKYLPESELVIPSVGVTSNVINLRLWELGAEVHSLDIGSLVDAAHGKGSRKWIRLKGHKINAILLPEYQNKSIRFKLESCWKDLRFNLRLIYRGKSYKLNGSGIKS